MAAVMAGRRAGLGQVDDRGRSIAESRRVDRGVTFFDTEVYGAGHSGGVLGRALAVAAEVVIATSFNALFEKHAQVKLRFIRRKASQGVRRICAAGTGLH
jgi:aryl-alcohol dehydrogenase-like predicted oxidoreductase